MKTAGKPLTRLPLQLGTTATWAVARAALALFPGIGAAIVFLLALKEGVEGEAAVIPIAVAAMFFLYTGFYLRLALRTRASDLLLRAEGLELNGGVRHGSMIAWAELSAPFAKVEQSTTTRLILWRLPIAGVLAVGGGDFEPEEKIPIWQLFVYRAGERTLFAETDRAIEAGSLEAAAASIEAVCSGRKSVEQAPKIRTELARCSACGAALIPEDSQTVVCAYCHATVNLRASVRTQAATANAFEKTNRRTAKMIARLLDQPQASTSNLWLLLLTLVMFGAWPIGWGLIAPRVFNQGLALLDVPYLGFPSVAVLAGFFFARGRVADRGALRLLTLGFGALAPKREGDPAQCRLCLAPLPMQGMGGVVQCRYCQAENIAGLDLRPVIDQERAEKKPLVEALRKYRSEKRLWLALSLLAVVLLGGWGWATKEYVRHMASRPGEPTKSWFEDDGDTIDP